MPGLSSHVSTLTSRITGVTGTQNLMSRERWLENALGALPAGTRILDAGAGECQYRRFCEHLDYTSQDFAQYEGRGNESGLHTGTWDNSKIDIVSDITEIPVPSGSFDAVMCIEVLEHVPDPSRAVSELVRVVRPGGELIITAPFNSLTHFAPFHFATGFNRYFYEQVFESEGCDILELSWNGNYFEGVAQELRRLDSIGRQYARAGLRPHHKLAAAMLLRRIGKMSAADSGSRDLSSHGLHVRARRRSPEA
jgi:ubiquinone/menaquinone biosynthesis C-methylase UbiE